MRVLSFDSTFEKTKNGHFQNKASEWKEHFIGRSMTMRFFGKTQSSKSAFERGKQNDYESNKQQSEKQYLYEEGFFFK